MNRHELYWKKQMKIAEERQDPLVYARACNELGITPPPALMPLYELGCAELVHQRGKRLGNEKKGLSLERVAISKGISDDKITKFLGDASDLCSTSFNECAEEKAEILMRYFPRFRPSGSQDLSRYDETQIGSIFEKLVDYYSD